ncbi:MAG: hypothetical protein L6E13_01515 [Firmicutes bacterium]|nr:hypothetical protein [Bacillota bacterium]
MADRIYLGPAGLPPVGPAERRPSPATPGAEPATRPGQTFREALAEALGSPEPIRLSAHAAQRLQASGRTLTPEETARIAAAVDRAASKGARESLVLLGDLALVVSVRNRTVITAVTGERMKENVFTNIDSAVIL